ncbi:SURF1-domain-containing protein [Basidiobolus meristosporus CBS 931.73]|uniref:SURF1-like protein n=1 Tax=Basidiobolus meristosporus CBS 931.73 TaxID=1314790 RepID=A0A1Y1Z8D7_9FUNG|nr:SURF1-domain-containing protein [Basidiobolus meristosporus CBS 931.73]|eukprot:ORY06085.1 SURF1-domain-containing protein [Basidiobolus meristosporus CBS 931.73]
MLLNSVGRRLLLSTRRPFQPSATFTSTFSVAAKRFQLQQSSSYVTAVSSKKSNPLKTGFMIMLPITCFFLGTWQVQRLRWKVDLIEEMESRLSKDPVPLPKKMREETYNRLEYCQVLVYGHYLHDQEMLVGPRTRGDGVPGYFIVTPFVRENGQKILVKRGWVSKDMKELRNRPESKVEGDIAIRGWVRKSERPNTFTPDNHPERGEWYVADVEKMSEISGAEPILVELLDDSPVHQQASLIDKGIPVGRQPTIDLRNNHMQYIITWYSLGVATTIMLYTLLRKPPKMKVKRFA